MKFAEEGHYRSLRDTVTLLDNLDIDDEFEFDNRADLRQRYLLWCRVNVFHHDEISEEQFWVYLKDLWRMAEYCEDARSFLDEMAEHEPLDPTIRYWCEVSLL